MGGTLLHVVCPRCPAEYVGTDDEAAWALFENHGRRGHDVRLMTLDAESSDADADERSVASSVS